jgi:hypothetical protein
MTKISLIILVILTTITNRSFAQAQSSGSLADLTFIEGHWKATTETRTVEGVWLAAEGDNILGMMRMMTAGKASLYEILAYEKNEQGFISLVKHFRPGLLGVEEKDKQDRYRFIEAAKGRAVFEKEDGTLRILYEKRGDNSFVIARGTQQNSQWVFKDNFVFTRVK